MNATCLFVLLAATLGVPAAPVTAQDHALTLSQLAGQLRASPRIASKGRIQDSLYNPDHPVARIVVARPFDAMELLVELVASDEPLSHPPLDLWPTMALGDLALAVALDLFTDANYRPTVAALTFAGLIGESDPGASAWRNLQAYRELHSRSELRDRLRETWLANGPYDWDSHEMCFRPRRPG